MGDDRVVIEAAVACLRDILRCQGDAHLLRLFSYLSSGRTSVHPMTMLFQRHPLLRTSFHTNVFDNACDGLFLHEQQEIFVNVPLIARTRGSKDLLAGIAVVILHELQHFETIVVHHDVPELHEAGLDEFIALESERAVCNEPSMHATRAHVNVVRARLPSVRKTASETS